MEKKGKISLPIVLFFLSTEIIAFSTMFFIFYPLLGIDIKKIISELPPSLILTGMIYAILSIILYFVIKPIDTIVENYEINNSISAEDRKKIYGKEKFIKKFFIIANVSGYIIAPIAGTITGALIYGFIRWATFRFCLAAFCLGPAIGILQVFFISYLMQKVKLKLNLYDLAVKKTKFPLKRQIIITMVSFYFLTNIFFINLAITREEKVGGITNIAVRYNEKNDEKPNGYFTKLMDIASKSDNQELKDEAVKLYNNWAGYSRKNIIYFSIIGFLLSLLFIMSVVIFASDISGHINNILKKLRSVVKLDGDLTEFLTHTTDSEIGEIQTLYNILILNINAKFSEIIQLAKKIIKDSDGEKENIGYLINANEEISGSSREVMEELAKQEAVSKKTALVIRSVLSLIEDNINRIINQSSMIEQSSAAVTEMNSSIQSVSKATQNANDLGNKLYGTLKEGQIVTQDMIVSIDNISQSGAGINDIVTSISAITDQTDILSMNAAIEAAHAGESGKGFGVVADEIRNLAENTGNQTKEIVKILYTMTGNIQKIVSSSSNLSKYMGNIQIDINSITQLINEINAAAQEQLINSNENLDAINKLVEITVNVKENLNEQKEQNQELNGIITEIEGSVKRIDVVGKKQEGYIKGLKVHFNNFSDYFTEIFDNLKLLEEKISNVKLLEENVIKENTKNVSI